MCKVCQQRASNSFRGRDHPHPARQCVCDGFPWQSNCLYQSQCGCIAAFCDARFSVGVGSGTAALHYALVAAGVRAGDCVITVPNTFIATTEAISQAGAMPELVDVDERTYNLDPAKLRHFLENDCDADLQTGRQISRHTGRPVTAVVPVHLYGQMADMDAILVSPAGCCRR